jgi:hypothetical protein
VEQTKLFDNDRIWIAQYDELFAPGFVPDVMSVMLVIHTDRNQPNAQFHKLVLGSAKWLFSVRVGKLLPLFLSSRIAANEISKKGAFEAPLAPFSS